MRKILVTLVTALMLASLLSTTTATAANGQNADSIFIGYDEEQVESLYRGAGYLDRTPEEFAADAVAVHHFLLGISQKLENPGGGCGLELEGLVDKTNGPFYFLIEDLSDDSVDAVGSYYCLSAQSVAEVSITLLVFLVFANANGLGVSVPDVEVPDSARPTGFPNPMRHVFVDPGAAIVSEPFFITSMIEDDDQQVLFFRAVRPDVACVGGAIAEDVTVVKLIRVELQPNGCANVADLPDTSGHHSFNEHQLVVFERPDQAANQIARQVEFLFEDDHTIDFGVYDRDGELLGAALAAFADPFRLSGVDRVVPPGGDIYGVPADLNDLLEVPRPPTPGGTCTPDAGTELCLDNGRFLIDMNLDYPMDATGNPLTGGNGDSGFFHTSTGQEVLVKVLDGCGINDHFWVFAGALSEVPFEMTVTDTGTGESRMFSNPLESLGSTVVDTQAFATCP